MNSMEWMIWREKVQEKLLKYENSPPSSVAFLLSLRRWSTTFLKITAAASTALWISASPSVDLCCWLKVVGNKSSSVGDGDDEDDDDVADTEDVHMGSTDRERKVR